MDVVGCVALGYAGGGRVWLVALLTRGQVSIHGRDCCAACSCGVFLFHQSLAPVGLRSFVSVDPDQQQRDEWLTDWWCMQVLYSIFFFSRLSVLHLG